MTAVTAANNTNQGYIVSNENRFITQMALKGYSHLKITIKCELNPFFVRGTTLVNNQIITTEDYAIFFDGNFASQEFVQQSFKKMRDRYAEGLSRLQRSHEFLVLKYEFNIVAGNKVSESQFVGEYFKQKGLIEGPLSSPLWNGFIGAVPQRPSAQIEALTDPESETSVPERSLYLRALI